MICVSGQIRKLHTCCGPSAERETLRGINATGSNRLEKSKVQPESEGEKNKTHTQVASGSHRKIFE